MQGKQQRRVPLHRLTSMKVSRIVLFLTLLLPLALSAQVRWTSRNPAPTTLALKAVAAGQGIYVAVTAQGTVVSSTDSINWRTETFPSSENLNNVAFANGHFFARGDSGTIFVSDDGHYWLQRLGGNVANSGGPIGHNIVYGNGTYVAVSAYGGNVATSPDTVTWTVLPGVFGDSVAFGGGIFVMVSLADDSIRTSTDGLVWKKITPAEFTWANQVAYGAGHFVVRRGSQLYRSSDAVTWTLISGVSASEVAFVKDRFIAQGSSTQQPITSLDGVAWTTHTGVTVLIRPSQIAGIDDSFVGFIGNKLYRSADALAWTLSGVNFSTAANYPGVAFARNRFLTGDGRTSVDGITWTTDGFAVPVANATDLTIHSANDRFFAFTGGSVYISTDGLTGTKTADLTFNPKSIAYGNGHYVAVGANLDGVKGGVATSTDALAWTDRSLAVNLPALIDVEYATNLFVAVGPTGAIYTSPDGLVWTHRPHPVTSAYGNALAYGAGRWVLVGMPSLTSTDGIEWSASTAPDGTAITYANGLFVLNAYWESANNFRFNPTATIATSPDGVHWTYRNTTNVNTGTFAFGNGSWVTAGYRGTLSQSSATDAALAPAFAAGLSAKLDPANKSHLTLDAPATGTGPISYQWFRQTSYFGDAVPTTNTSSTLNLTNWTSVTGDVFTLVATSSYGSATIPYRISYQTSQLDPTGYNSGIARIATPTTDGQLLLALGNAYSSSQYWFGPGPISFQWYKDGVLIPNANASSITVPYDAAKDSDSIFTLALTNLFGRVDFDYDLTTQITLTPSSQTLLPGTATTFTARVTSTLANSVVTFTWKKNGQTIRTVDATVGTFTQTAVDSLVLSNLQSSDYGVYQFTVSNQLGTIASDYFTLAPPSVTRLVNLSVRAHVGTGDDVLIAGFVGNGTGAGPNILARGIGPTLSTLGITAPLARPHLALKNASGVTLATNEKWDVQPGYDAAFLRDVMTRIGAFPLLAGSADAAILRPGALNTAQPPRLTTILSGIGSTTGVGLIEFYEFAPSSERLVNLSARARVGSGENVLIAGFVITGDKPLKLLIRGVGPTLAGQGITSPLSNPKITLFDSAGREIHNNDQWNAAANVADLRAATTVTGAFALVENSNDAAMLESLAPGVYSVHVTSVAGTSGIALVEIYEAP
jgi:hypothetical protein